MYARHTSGGFKIVQNQAQMLSIPYLYRTDRTIVYVQDTKILYQLKSPIPTSNTTTMADWSPVELGGASSFRPVGEWDPYINEPFISDETAVGRNGEFYFVKNVTIQDNFTFSDPVLFQGNMTTLANGNMIVSVGGYWLNISQTTSWDALIKPQVINDYVAGIVQYHTHDISEITGLSGLTGGYYTVADTADHTIPFDSVPDLKIVEVEFLRQWYYNKTYADSTFLKKIGDSGVFAFTFANNQGIDTDGTGGVDVLNIGTNNADVINIGRTGATVNILGTVNYETQNNLAVEDKLIRLNVNGAASSGFGVGFEIEEGGTGVITGYFKTNGTRDGYLMNSPANAFDAEFLMSSLTGNRTYTLPNSSGTLALVSSTLSTSLDAGKIWVGDAVNVAQQRALSGDATLSNTGVMTISADAVTTSKILNSAVTYVKIQNVTTDKLLGRDTAGSGVVEEIGVSGGIEFTGSGAIQTSAFTGDVTKTAGGTSLTISNNVVTYAKIQDVSATSRILGRITSGAGDIEELTGTQATTLLDVFTDALKGLTPASGGGTSNFLRADGTWAAPGGTGHAIINGADVSALTQRANLRFRNGLTAADNAPDTDAKLGGALIENTTLSGSFWLNVNPANFAVFSSSPDFEEGQKIMFMGVCTTPPTTPPTQGVFIWVELINSNYELRVMDSAGNVKGLS